MTALDQALTEHEVLAAADELVAAFGATDTARYFAAFAPDADFVFHTEPDRLLSRAAYERLWGEWLATGWRVDGCRSTARTVRLLGETAVFVHDVLTATIADGARTETHERETIVFVRQPGGELLAVHEHLSPRAA